MIQLERVVLRNFGSWKHLDFPLSNQGLVLLSGPTGSGKSTIFRAVYWCLFGKTSEGHRVSDLCRHGTTRCSVRLDLVKEAPFGAYATSRAPYSITRYRNHPVWKNKVSIIGPGVPKVDPDSLMDDTGPLIEQLLGFGPEIFSKVFYFVQRDTQRFSSMTDLERKVFLETLTHGAFLQACEKAAREQVRSLTRDLDLIRERERTREELLGALRRQAEVSQQGVSEELQALEAQEKLARQELLRFRRLHEDSISNWYTLSASLESKMHFHERARASLRQMSGVCPVCASPVSKSQRRERFQHLGESLKDLVKEHRSYERHIQELESLKDAVFALEAQQAKVRDTFRLRGSQVAGQPSAQVTLQSQQDEKQRLDNQNRLLYTQYWVKGFGPLGLRSYMVSHVVRQLTTYIDGYLSMIDPTLKASFVVRDQRVVFVGDESRSLATFSGGERQALDLAVGLSLRNLLETSTETMDSLILDEPFEGLDQTLQVACQRLLYALPKKSVFLVTHSRFLARFSKEYEVSKVQGISQLQLVKES